MLIVMQVIMCVNVHPQLLPVLLQRLVIAVMVYVSAARQVPVLETLKVHIAIQLTMPVNVLHPLPYVPHQKLVAGGSVNVELLVPVLETLKDRTAIRLTMLVSVLHL